MKSLSRHLDSTLKSKAGRIEHLPDAGGIVAQGRQLGLLREEALGAADGLLTGRDGGHQGLLGFREYAPHLGVLRLRMHVKKY